VTRTRGLDIDVFNGAISDDYKKLYIDLIEQKNARMLKKKRSNDGSIMGKVVVLQDTPAVSLQATTNRGKYERQGAIPGMFNASVHTKLGMVVANFIYGHALSFHLTETACFQ
jgi:hypothetical protein